MLTVQERTNVTHMKGQPLTLLGPEIRKGDTAPDFTAVKQDLSDFESGSLKGRVVLLLSVPSLDTGVCAAETRRFSQEAASLAPEVAIIVISMDLPFAQKRFCVAEGIDRLTTVSDYKHRSFGEAYGVLIKELGLLSRAVFIVNRDGAIAYARYLEENAQEPDYEEVLGELKKVSRG